MYNQTPQPIYYIAPNSTIAESSNLSQSLFYYSANKQLHQLSDTDCIAAGCKIPNCIIVDMGHVSIRLYDVQNKTIVSHETLSIGGAALAQFFVKLIIENQNKFEGKPGKIV